MNTPFYKFALRLNEFGWDDDLPTSLRLRRNVVYLHNIIIQKAFHNKSTSPSWFGARHLVMDFDSFEGN